MNLTQLKVFCEVMKSGSISKTANVLGRTQPAITQSIKGLEESIGFKLFDRQGRQLVAVPEAHYLLEEAQLILERMHTLDRNLNSLKEAKSGSLNVASMPGPVVHLLPHFISQAMGKNSDITISLISRSSTQVYELAATQSIDFGFADAGTVSKDGEQYQETVISGDCFCAVPADHELANLKVIDVVDLKDQPMAGMQDQHLNTNRIAYAFSSAGIRYNKQISSQTYWPLLSFVSAGQCLAVVDPLTAITEQRLNSTQGKVVFLPLRQSIRYEYAVLSGQFRPMSRLASRILKSWIDEVVSLLDEVGANPELVDA